MSYTITGFSGSGEVSLELDKARFKQVQTAKAVCLVAWDLEEKLSLLLDNFYELEVELLKLAQDLVIWAPHEFLDTMERRLRLDRRLVNVLTACRLYLDQTDHLISGLFGDGAEEFKKIKAFKNNLHANSWGYRLMEALRNHAQHAGLIVHSIGYHRKNHYRQEHGQSVLKATEFTILPQTSIIEILAQNPEFKKSVLDELIERSGGNDLVDLRPSIREYVSCLIEIHFEIRALLKHKTDDSRNIYEKALEEFAVHDGQKILFPTLQEVDDTGKTHRTPLVTEFLQALDSITTKNSTVTKTVCRFASNRASE